MPCGRSRRSEKSEQRRERWGHWLFTPPLSASYPLRTGLWKAVACRVTAVAGTTSKYAGVGNGFPHSPQQQEQPSWDVLPSHSRPSRVDTCLPPSQPTWLAESPPYNKYKEDRATSPSSSHHAAPILEGWDSTHISITQPEWWSNWQHSALFICLQKC